MFGSNFQKRAYGYARVISIAADEKSPHESMCDFITNRGGIEQLRRTKPNGKTPAIERKDNIAFAMSSLNKSKALVTPFKISSSTRTVDEGAEHSLFVAVMRQDADGCYSMVYETSSKSVVNAALEQAGKEQRKQKQHKDAEAQQSQNANASEQAASTAAALAKAA